MRFREYSLRQSCYLSGRTFKIRATKEEFYFSWVLRKKFGL
jgi:hypothetical protein